MIFEFFIFLNFCKMEDELQSFLPLPSWKPHFKRGEHFAMLLVGGRKSGKSTFIRYAWVTYKMDTLFDLVIIITKSRHNALGNDFFDFVQTKKIFINPTEDKKKRKTDEDSLDIVYRVLDENQAKKERGEKPIEVCFLCDDFTGVRVKYNDHIDQLFLRGRNSNASVIKSDNDITCANTWWRGNSDYVAGWEIHNEEKIETFCKTFMPGTIHISRIPKGWKQKDFFMYLFQCTAIDHVAVVMDYHNPNRERRLTQLDANPKIQAKRKREETLDFFEQCKEFIRNDRVALHIRTLQHLYGDDSDSE